MISRQTISQWLIAIATIGLTGGSSLSALALANPAPLASPTLSTTLSATPTATPTITPPATEFFCIQADSHWATVARREPTITPPMILWTTSLGGYTAEERCNIVSTRLTRAVSETGGKLRNLMLTYGRINGSKVVCYVQADTEGCTSSNILFTLRPSDDPDQVLRRIVAFSVQASGAPVQQSRGRTYVRLGEAVESCLLAADACVVEETSEDVPDPESSDAESGGI